MPQDVTIQPKHALFSLKIISAVIIVSIGILLISYARIKLFPEKIIVPKISIGIENLQQEGNDISFIVNVLSNRKRKYTLELNYQLINDKGINVFEHSEKLSFDTREYKAVKLDLPEGLADGKYKLNIFTTFAGKKLSAVKTINFLGTKPETIEKKPITKIQKPITNDKEPTCDDSNQCTKDYFEDEQCSHEQIIPCCGNSLCEANEDTESCDIDCITEKPLTKEAILAEVDKLKSQIPEKAATYCRQLIFIYDRDSCYSDIALTAKNTKYCTLIDSSNKKDLCFSIIANATTDVGLCTSIKSEAIRDSCYVQFILAGDYSYCEKLSNNYLRDSCRLLEK